jgi:branched-chain amino acid transport system permease protein
MRSRAVSTDGFSLKRCILDAIFSGLVALIIFGPIAGVVLDGYSFNFAGQRLAWMVGIVMLGRFLLSAFLGTPLAHASRHVLTLTARAFMSGHRNTRAACAG